MIKSYIKIALRNVIRQKAYSLINIAGLSVGMACCMLLLLWVQDEIGYDKHHRDADRIYRVYKEYLIGDGADQNPSTPFPLAIAAREQVPAIVSATTFSRSSAVVKCGEEVFTCPNACYADSLLFDVLSYEFVHGNVNAALSDPNSVVLTQDMARRCFGDDDPMGRMLTLNNRHGVIVAGVVKDPPNNSDFRYGMFAPISLIIGAEDREDWGSHWLTTLVRLNDAGAETGVEAELTSMIRERLPDQEISLGLQPLGQVHLFDLDGSPAGMKYVYLFSIIALVILVIACINYMNLATARASRRSREIALRKVAGATVRQLRRQFFGESIIFGALALPVAFILLELAIPGFGRLTGKQLATNSLAIGLLPGMAAIALFAGIMSGVYPALFLSRFQPSKVLKGHRSNRGQGLLFRRSLVVLQFALSIILLIGTGVIYSQMEYVKNADLGFDRQNVVYLPANRTFNSSFDAIRNELLKHSGVVNVARTSEVPTEIWSIMRGVEWEGKETPGGATFGFVSADWDYIETARLNVVEGRGFSREFPSDSLNYLINEKAAEMMGMSDPVGRPFSLRDDPGGSIIGVVRDFHCLPFSYEIEPMIIAMMPGFYHEVMIRIESDDVSGTVAHIERVWKHFMPDYPFEFSFLNDDFDRMYEAEQRAGNVFGLFVILAVFVSCLGLTGLAAFAASQRTREIGIRKVLGASSTSVVTLLIREFGILVAVASIIAWPVAYLVMSNWLEGFVYRTNMTVTHFVLGGVIALIIALLTVSYQAVRAALANPVDSLRHD